MSLKNLPSAERKSGSKKRSLIAAIVGLTAAGLVFGSTTTALWSDSVTVDGGTITSGNLDVERLGDMVWTEASSDVIPRTIDVLEDYKIIPGNTIRGQQPLDVALHGTNMLATFQVVSDSEVEGNLYKADGMEGVGIEYWVEDKAGNPLTPRRAFGSDSPLLNITKDDVSETLDSQADYNVFIQAVFDKNTPGQVRVQAQALLAKSSVELRQVRVHDDVEPIVQPRVEHSFVYDGYNQGVIDVGDQVLYSVDVVNDGVVPMDNVSVTDVWLNANGTEFTSDSSSFGSFGVKVAAPTYSLAPGEKRTYKAVHTFTPEQLDSGSIVVKPVINYEVAGTVGNLSTNTTIDSPATQFNAAISSVAAANLGGNGTYTNTANKVDFGETADIVFTVKNESSVNAPLPTMTSVTGGLVASDFTVNKTGELAPGESVAFTATKAFTVQELSVGSVTVTAAFESTVGGQTATSSKSVVLQTVPVTNDATINFIQSLQDSNSNGTGDVGEQLNISGTWTNTSNVAVKYTGVSGKAGTVWTSQPTVNTIVNPGQSLSFNGYYTLASGDVTGSPVSVTYTVNWSPKVVAQGGQASRNSQVSRSTNTTVQSKTLSFTAASTSGTFLKNISTPWGSTWYPWRETTYYNYPQFYSDGGRSYNTVPDVRWSGQLWNTSKNSVDITIGGISGFSPGIAFSFDSSGVYPKGLIAVADGSYWNVYGSTGGVNAGVASAYNNEGSAGVTITTLRVVSNGTTAQVYANGSLVWNKNITNLNGYNYSTGTYHGIGGYWSGTGPRFTSFSMTS